MASDSRGATALARKFQPSMSVPSRKAVQQYERALLNGRSRERVRMMRGSSGYGSIPGYSTIGPKVPYCLLLLRKIVQEHKNTVHNREQQTEQHNSDDYSALYSNKLIFPRGQLYVVYYRLSCNVFESLMSDYSTVVWARRIAVVIIIQSLRQYARHHRSHHRSYHRSPCC